MSTLYRARVIRVDGDGVFVEIPDLGSGAEWGPLALLQIEVAAGDQVLVGSVGDTMEDIVLFGALTYEAPAGSGGGLPANGSAVLYYENAAARTAASLTLVSGLTTWLDDEQQLDIYTDEGTPGWVTYYGVKGGFLKLPDDLKIGVGVTAPTATFETALDVATDPFLKVSQDADTQPRWWISGNGVQSWGPGGSTAVDVTLKRANSAGIRVDPHFGIGSDPDATHFVYAVTGAVGASVYYAKSTVTNTVPLFQGELSAAAAPVFSSKVTADTNQRFSISGAGDHTWGPGNTATDATLKRVSTAGMRIDPRLGVGTDPDAVHFVYISSATVGATVYYAKSTVTNTAALFQAEQSASAAPFAGAKVTGDTNNRFAITGAGDISWGPGSGATDSGLLRVGVGLLRVNTKLGVNIDPLTTTQVYINVASASTRGLHIKQANGTQTVAVLQVESASTEAASTAYQQQLTGDANPRFYIQHDGKLWWGGATGVVDTNLYRSAANVLKTDDAMVLASTLEVDGAIQWGSTSAVTVGNSGISATGTTTSTTFTNTLTTSGIFGVAFVAPPSGKVMVSIGATGFNSTASQYTLMDFEVRTGSTAGSGTSVRASNEETATANMSAIVNHAMNHATEQLVSGLTPGTTYNATVTYRVTANTGSYGRRKVHVVPVI